MVKKFYVDTCIWRDLLEDRKSGFLPLGEIAFNFLSNCRANGCVIGVSPFVVKELSAYFSVSEIDALFEPFLEQIIFFEPSRGVIKESFSLAEKINGIHQADILHALIAKEQGCVLITRDRHFDYMVGIVTVCLPEEVSFD